jgi:hypothetical protein
MATTNEIITIEGEEVNFLRRLPGTFDYKPTMEDENGNKVPNTESPLHGKKYYRFAYNDTVFTVHTEDDFVRLYENDNLYAVRFSQNTAGQLTLIAGVSFTKATRNAKADAAIKKYRNGEVELSEVNEDLLSSLQN